MPETITITASTSGVFAATIAPAWGSTSAQVGDLGSMPFMIPAGQEYYWSPQWRASEHRAQADLRYGRSRQFSDPDDALRYLFEVRD